MEAPRDLSTYGGPYSDLLPVEDPTVEQSAAFGNRLMTDVAQMSRTSEKGWVIFPLSTGGAGVISASSVTAQSHWGTGSSEKPVVEKTATGTYTLTYAASYVDEVGTTENVVIRGPRAAVLSTTTFGFGQCTVAGSVITLKVQSTGFVDSDLGGATIMVWFS